MCVVLVCMDKQYVMGARGPRVAPHGTARHGTARHGTVPARHGMVWYGTGMAWYDMAWGLDDGL